MILRNDVRGYQHEPSLALNPIIKFTTLFGLLAVELAVRLTAETGGFLTHVLAAVFFAVSFFFVYQSFYGMRIRSEGKAEAEVITAADSTHAKVH